MALQSMQDPLLGELWEVYALERITVADLRKIEHLEVAAYVSTRAHADALLNQIAVEEVIRTRWKPRSKRKRMPRGLKASPHRATHGHAVVTAARAPAQRLAIPHEGHLPLAVARWADPLRRAVFIAVDDAMLETLAAVLPAFLPDRPVLELPAWDSPPYDRSRPSRAVTGRRVATLAWLAEHHEQRVLVLTTPESLTQRIPPADRLLERSVRLGPGQSLDDGWLEATLAAFGYEQADRVTEPGEFAVHLSTADVFPAGGQVPIRIEFTEDKAVASIRQFDPDDQLSFADAGPVLLLPASEGFTVPGEDMSGGRNAQRLLPDGPLWTLFDLLRDAAFAIMDGTKERIADWLPLVRDSYNVALTSIRDGAPAPLAPDALYLNDDEIAAALNGRQMAIVSIEGECDEPALSIAAAARRANELRARGDAVVVCADAPTGSMRRALGRRLREDSESVAELPDWGAALQLQPGKIGVARIPLRTGFHLPRRSVLAIQVNRPSQASSDVLESVSRLRIGDLVVEPERGLAELAALVTEDQAGGSLECLSLAFRSQTNLLVPATEAGRVWRYGASGSRLPDRLEGAAWLERRRQTEQEIEGTATRLVEQMRERAAREAPTIELREPYRQFVRRMPFAATADQVQAIDATRQDLAGGHPMLRLICGDVGFGKTEVALHAAAIVAFAGYQVAVVAPTTLLARQHLDTFRRRLSGAGLRIAPLLRGSRSPQSRDVLRSLARGETDIVIGTHTVIAARFRNLGLMVIDEEQRFGEAQKRALREKRSGAHVLIMTATPLPRTLQAALVGMVGVSVLAQPPAGRLPIRSVVAPFDPVVVRTALMREARRGGQAFVVCPRIEDLAPMQKQLQAIVPELSVVMAHGRQRADTLDRTMLEFASGTADVLLTTNIVEAGLDIPNANTMLIWRADRFGLAQLHQLRGRVGRGRVRASTYLLTDPAHPPSPATQKRLKAASAFSQLGTNLDLSLADLEQRGAGDLLGEEQAGHIRLIGTELYRHLMTRAVAHARGESITEEWSPAVVVNADALIPADFVPEPEERLDIYRRLARATFLNVLDELSAELDDRFGTLPRPVITLLDIVRLRVVCRELGIAALHAGPQAIALTPRGDSDALLHWFKDARLSGDRVIVPSEPESPDTGLRHVLQVLSGRVSR